MVITPSQQPTEADTPHSEDIIEDVLRVCRKMAPGFSEAIMREVDAEVRPRWVGDRPYINGKAGEGRSTRNDAIVRDYLKGEQISFLSIRYQLTQRRILQILKSR